MGKHRLLGGAWKSIALGVGVGVVGGVIAYNAAKQEGATGKDLALETAKADNPTKRANERGFALQ